MRDGDTRHRGNRPGAARRHRRDLRGGAAATDTRIVVRGCLDGLSDVEVDALPPRDGDDTLYTRLRGERDVKISKAAVIERAPATLEALRRDGADALLFACTGAFPPMRGDAGVVFPSRILAGLAAGATPDRPPRPSRAGAGADREARRKMGAARDRDRRRGAPAERVRRGGEAAAASACGPPPGSRRDGLHELHAGDSRGARRVVDAPTLLAVSATARVLQELLA